MLDIQDLHAYYGKSHVLHGVQFSVGKTLLTVEHDMGVVFGLADKIAVVVYGEVIAFDTPAAVRANPRVQEAYLGSAVADAQGGH